MANLMGTIQGNRGKVHRLGSREVEAVLETWTGRVRVTLYSDGQFTVYTGTKDGSMEQVDYHGKVP